MGIKNINSFLKETAASGFIEISLSIFSKRRIAIDGNLRIYEFMSIATRNIINNMKNPIDEIIDHEAIVKEATDTCLDFIKLLFSYSITPVWIFDGSSSSFKSDCIKERQEIRSKKMSKIEEERCKFENVNPLKITTQDYKNFKKILSQHVTITYKDIQVFKKLLSDLGIPVFIAPHDGEKLCSALNREGLVAGVWGNDTDNYALGTPILITGIESRLKGKHTVNVIRLENILNTLHFTPEMMMDFCIMCGCDFNSNISGIGPKNSFKLISRYQNIENLPVSEGKKILDRSVLNHLICRSLFSYESSGISDENCNIDWDVYNTNRQDIISQYTGRSLLILPKIEEW
jgi:5'-3' exonuclease